MVNIESLDETFEKNKKYIIEALQSFYGKRYQREIQNKIDNVYYNFRSTPEEDYEYLQSHKDEISEKESKRIEDIYEDFEEINKQIHSDYKNRLMDIILDTFRISGIYYYKRNNDTFVALLLMLFSPNGITGPALIDSFSTESINLYQKNPKAAYNIRLSHDLFRDSLKRWGVHINNLKPEVVDEFIKRRNNLKTKCRIAVLERTTYGIEEQERIRTNLQAKISTEEIAHVLFKKNAGQSITFYENKNGIYVPHHMITIPITQGLNQGTKAMDTTLIHESIHKAESYKHYVGIEIHDKMNSNEIINEVRTQMAAIKITSEIHENGIFIFDDPDDYKIEGECTYESVFPLIKPFIEKYEDLFTELAINNSAYELFSHFGNDWIEFSRLIDTIYRNHRSLAAYQINSNENKRRVKTLINRMQDYKK